MDAGDWKQDFHSLMGRIIKEQLCKTTRKGVQYIHHLMNFEQCKVIICKYFAMNKALPKGI